ncbi:hypothetical protein BZG36_03564 [Bifiguratus adelaidae]|uniref:Small acidic protein n=1 Tax=Bifiguratus adelaidae TaxID=1938954 RepID=A0A261Y0F4_9FUNG|nr:hypothetical protein BZG36_03564 [Bifiguratus adelaidae]
MGSGKRKRNEGEEDVKDEKRLRLEKKKRKQEAEQGIPASDPKGRDSKTTRSRVDPVSETLKADKDSRNERKAKKDKKGKKEDKDVNGMDEKKKKKEKEKKEKKKAKEPKDDNTSLAEASSKQTSSKKKMKASKRKQDDGDKKTTEKATTSENSAEAAAKATESAQPAGWNDWSKATFEGDASRQDKFLRLLGGKKKDSTGKGLFGSLQPSGTSTFDSAIDANVAKRIEQDMTKQFEDGLKFRKQKQMGKRGGLGFN